MHTQNYTYSKIKRTHVHTHLGVPISIKLINYGIPRKKINTVIHLNITLIKIIENINYTHKTDYV